MTKQKKLVFGIKEFTATNLEKVFWPELGITKGDLIEYYKKISSYILPYLKDRPESLHRFPNGISKKSFYQKDIDGQFPEWIKRWDYHSKADITTYLLCQDKATLLYMVQLGCIEINPWNSRYNNPNIPDYSVLDLDPLEISFDAVIETTITAKKLLDELNITHFAKTSGATGIHIFIPLEPRYFHTQSKHFAQILANLINKKLPKITSVERMPAKRIGRVYVDFLQNNPGQTLASVYSVRPNNFAGVSTPIVLADLKKGFKPDDFTINNIFQRLDMMGDLFSGIFSKRNIIEDSLKRINDLNL